MAVVASCVYSSKPEDDWILSSRVEHDEQLSCIFGGILGQKVQIRSASEASYIIDLCCLSHIDIMHVASWCLTIMKSLLLEIGYLKPVHR